MKWVLVPKLVSCVRFWRLFSVTFTHDQNIVSDVNIMPEETIRRPPLCSPCCLQNGIDNISICTQACNNASGIWEKGNVSYKCESYKEAINAFDKANETWPWVRSLRRSPQTTQSPSLDRPSMKDSQILQRMTRWLLQLY
jgi:hypothetical protein